LAPGWPHRMAMQAPDVLGMPGHGPRPTRDAEAGRRPATSERSARRAIEVNVCGTVWDTAVVKHRHSRMEMLRQDRATRSSPSAPRAHACSCCGSPRTANRSPPTCACLARVRECRLVRRRALPPGMPGSKSVSSGAAVMRMRRGNRCARQP
jgi:hypothetical protein